jgi:hypothetical protein
VAVLKTAALQIVEDGSDHARQILGTQCLDGRALQFDVPGLLFGDGLGQALGGQLLDDGLGHILRSGQLRRHPFQESVVCRSRFTPQNQVIDDLLNAMPLVRSDGVDVGDVGLEPLLPLMLRIDESITVG